MVKPIGQGEARELTTRLGALNRRGSDPLGLPLGVRVQRRIAGGICHAMRLLGQHQAHDPGVRPSREPPARLVSSCTVLWAAVRAIVGCSTTLVCDTVGQGCRLNTERHFLAGNRELALHTAKGWQIPNEQIDEISAFEKNWGAVVLARWGRFCTCRTDLTPRYNCHGLVFASRRTCITEPTAISRILADDGYVEIQDTEVLAGDIIVYYSAEGDPEHSAVVVQPGSEGSVHVPFVLGKWGKGAEMIHPANWGPYNFANAKYYRVRP